MELAAIDALKEKMDKTLPSEIKRVRSEADGASWVHAAQI